MARPVLDGKLSRSSRSANLRIVRARPDHDTAIRGLLRASVMEGDIQLSFEREPNYFASMGIAATGDTTVLAWVNDRLVGMGRCTVRMGWFGGELKRLAYLGELRVAREAPHPIGIIKAGYDAIRSLRTDADVCYTSIAADNKRARRLLERGVPGLPKYHFLTEFVTLLVPVRRRAKRRSRLRFQPASECDLPALRALLDHHGARYSLATHWSENDLTALGRHGLPLADFQLAFDRNRLVACGALWDQRLFRQTVIRGYSRTIRCCRPAINLAARLIRRPTLPSVGAVVSHAFVSPLANEAGAEAIVPALVESLFPHAYDRGLASLALGFCAEDPRLTQVREEFGGQVYRTRLYQVLWPGDQAEDCGAIGRAYMPEVALL